MSLPAIPATESVEDGKVRRILTAMRGALQTRLYSTGRDRCVTINELLQAGIITEDQAKRLD